MSATDDTLFVSVTYRHYMFNWEIRLYAGQVFVGSSRAFTEWGAQRKNERRKRRWRDGE